MVYWLSLCPINRDHTAPLSDVAGSVMIARTYRVGVGTLIMRVMRPLPLPAAPPVVLEAKGRLKIRVVASGIIDCVVVALG